MRGLAEQRKESAPVASVFLVIPVDGKWPSRLIETLVAQDHQSIELLVLIPELLAERNMITQVESLWNNNPNRSTRTFTYRLDEDGPEFDWKQVTGNYVFVPDLATDLHPGFLSKLIHILEQNKNIDMVHCNGALVNEHDEAFCIAPLIDTSTRHSGDLFKAALVKEFSSNLGTAVMRAATLQLVEPQRINPDPIIFHRQLALQLYFKSNVGYVPEQLVKLVLSHESTAPLSASLSLRQSLDERFHTGTSIALDHLGRSDHDIHTTHFVSELVHLRTELVLELRFRLKPPLHPAKKRLGDLIQSWLRQDHSKNQDFETVEQLLAYIDILLKTYLHHQGHTELKCLVEQGNTIMHTMGSAPHFFLHGAGAAGLEILKTMKSYGFSPTAIWDNSGDPELSLDGFPVTLPKPELLSRMRGDRTLILALKDTQVCKEIALDYAGVHGLNIVQLSDLFAAQIYFGNQRLHCLAKQEMQYA